MAVTIRKLKNENGVSLTTIRRVIELLQIATFDVEDGATGRNPKAVSDHDALIIQAYFEDQERVSVAAGSKLVRQLEYKHLTHEQIAEALKPPVDKSLVSKWLHNQRAMRRYQYRQLEKLRDRR